MTVTATLASKVVVPLALSLTQTPKYTVPGAAPVLFQSKAALAEYDCTRVQVLEVAGRIQNSYRGPAWLQPAPTPVMVLWAPVPCTSELGAALAVTELQAAELMV